MEVRGRKGGIVHTPIWHAELVTWQLSGDLKLIYDFNETLCKHGDMVKVGTSKISRHSGACYSRLKVLSGWQWAEVTNLPAFQDASKDASCTRGLAAWRASLGMLLLSQGLPQRGNHRWPLQSESPGNLVLMTNGWPSRDPCGMFMA